MVLINRRVLITAVRRGIDPHPQRDVASNCIAISNQIVRSFPGTRF